MCDNAGVTVTVCDFCGSASETKIADVDICPKCMCLLGQIRDEAALPPSVIAIDRLNVGRRAYTALVNGLTEWDEWHKGKATITASAFLDWEPCTIQNFGSGSYGEVIAALVKAGVSLEAIAQSRAWRSVPSGWRTAAYRHLGITGPLPAVAGSATASAAEAVEAEPLAASVHSHPEASQEAWAHQHPVVRHHSCPAVVALRCHPEPSEAGPLPEAPPSQPR